MDDPAGPAPAARRLLPLLLVVATGALLFFPGLGNHDLWDPNEPVFAEAAREMRERGTWLLPYVNGQVYLDKPIFYFWTLLAASWPGGEVTALSVRVPGALAALLTLVAVLGAGRRAFGTRAGVLAALVLTTMPVFVWEARFAQMDPLLTLFMLLALLCFARAREGRAAPWLAASGAWAGLAMLTKGPVGLALPGAAAVILLAWERDLSFLRRPAWLAGAAAFVLVAAPWYLWLAVAGHGEWLREFFLRQNLGRFVDPFDHARPFTYYGRRFLTDLFPWCLLLPVIVLDRPRGPGRERDAWRLLAIYVAVVAGFFSLSGAKGGVYILPLYPAYALLAGRTVHRVLAGLAAPAHRRAAAWLGAAGGAVLAAFGAYLLTGARGRYPEFADLSLVLGALAAAGGTASALLLRARRGAPAVAAMLSTLAALYLVAALAVIPRVDPLKSARAFSGRILAHAGDAPVRSFNFWKWRSSYLFYTRRLMPNMSELADVDAYLARPEPVYLLVRDPYREALEAHAADSLVLLESATVGAKTVYLYRNRGG